MCIFYTYFSPKIAKIFMQKIKKFSLSSSEQRSCGDVLRENFLGELRWIQSILILPHYN